MRGEELKAIARREVDEIFTAGDLAVVDELYAADYIGHDPTRPEPIRGPAGVKEQVSGYRTAFPDLQLTADEIVAEGDLVVTRWTGRGTHTGELMGIAPTGKEVTVSGITIARLANGKIAEEWELMDALGMMVQLGAVPQPATA